MTRVPRVAVVAGSGLSLTGILDTVHWEEPFEAFEGLSAASVAGHTGSFIAGVCGNVEVLLQQGRRHFYEGISFDAVTAPVRALASQGVTGILFTNAAGGLKPDFEPGTLMAVARLRTWPYRNWAARPEQVIPDWAAPGCDASGLYVWVHGPSYETRAEIGALQHLGGDAVGMSTAPEMAAAQALGIRTAAVSCITNNCCRMQHLTHDDVLSTARRASERLCALLRQALPEFARIR